MRIQRQKLRTYIPYLSVCLGIIGLVFLLFYFYAHIVKGTDQAFSWLTGDLNAAVEEAPQTQQSCTSQDVYIGNLSSTTENLCVYQADGFRYGIRSSQDGPNQFVVGFPSDQRMYVVDSMPTPSNNAYVIWAPDSKNLVYRIKPHISGRGEHIYIIKDFASKITRYVRTDLSYGYTLNGNAAEPLIHDENGTPIFAFGMSVSENGEWLSAELNPGKAGGLVRVNMQNFEKLLYSKYQPQYGLGLFTNIEFSVSNDGKHIAVAGRNVSPHILSIEPGCGLEFDVFYTAWQDVNNPLQLQNPCPYREISRVVHDLVGDGYLTQPKLNPDGGELSVRVVGPNNTITWVKLTASGYIAPSGLDYLALGDSYSSGEGDTETDQYGNKYYRTYTDNEEYKAGGIPREKCHISSRSYPYLLAEGMSLTRTGSLKQWDSVACSGAHVYDVNSSNIDSYEGQYSGVGDPLYGRLHGFSNKDSLEVAALNDFIPGRKKQIEFVEKYKPNVITLTMGGNDIGFGDKIAKCANPFTLEQTCDLATLSGRADFGNTIRNQYEKLSQLYLDLHSASDGKAKIYVLGYPEFINGGANASCGLNIGLLNSHEREMIWQSVIYFNNVIEQAARAAGARYIDIETSLHGGRLCDAGQEYMTGVVGTPIPISNQQQESFHPNAKGHERIAAKIQEQLGNESLLTFNVCPDPNVSLCPDANATKASIDTPSYFSDGPQPQRTTEYKQMTWPEIVKSTLFNIALPPYFLQPGSTVQAILHSDPVDLGEFTANADGSLAIGASIPDNASPGYHTLVLEGESYTGELIRFEQIILVKGTQPDDIDENGIPDTQQVCGPFIEASGTDRDIDGIDDACDPYIDPVPRPIYKLRAGDSERTYQGNPERTDYLYLERNIYAKSFTGISGDHDPDGDGYAVIAASQDSSPSGRYANFQTFTNQQPNQVYVSFRTPENGCVKYRPTDLSKVTSSSGYRTFTEDAIDTDTCRSQPATDDTDNDGQPDNAQVLYVGRNGDPSKGETPTRLYLFRSTRGAEAQLGISDYAAPLEAAPSSIAADDQTDYRQPWSLLASSQSNPLLPITYQGVHMVGNLPYVVAKTNTGGLCQAYKPTNVGTIRQSTQTATNLTLDTVQTLNAVIGGWCN